MFDDGHEEVAQIFTGRPAAMIFHHTLVIPPKRHLDPGHQGFHIARHRFRAALP